MLLAHVPRQPEPPPGAGDHRGGAHLAVLLPGHPGGVGGGAPPEVRGAAPEVADARARVTALAPSASAGRQAPPQGDRARAGLGQTYELADELTLGRAAGLRSPRGGRLHLDPSTPGLYRRNGSLWVEDLGSTNGTWVNAERIGTHHQARQGRPAPGGRHGIRGDGRVDRFAGGSLTVLRSGSASDVGRVRTVNEDLALESLTLFAVADGMGGHVGGEIAARIAIDTLQAEFAREPSADGLVEAVHEANRAVWERGHADTDSARHGHHHHGRRPGGHRRRRPAGARQRRATRAPTGSTAASSSS